MASPLTMTHAILKKRPLATFLFLSLLAHFVAFSLLTGTGAFELSAPVGAGRYLSVELEEKGAVEPAQGDVEASAAAEEGGEVAPAGEREASVSPEAGSPATQENETPEMPAPQGVGGQVAAASQHDVDIPAAVPPPHGAGRLPASPPPAAEPAVTQQPKRLQLPPPLRRGDEFVAAAREKLTYRITLRGIPVGEAVLLATNDRGAVRITVQVTSTPFISAIYPVDDLIETELIVGNYLVTTIRQHEGNLRRNTGFTLMLREKKAFSTAKLREGFATQPLPRSDVTDVVFGFYYLRSYPLEVGKPLLLHIFDSGRYAPTTVEVLRQERVTVSGLGEVETLVILPHLQTPGIFRRTGDMLIWLTADGRKVPVRVETTIPIGKVRAELVSSEVEWPEVPAESADSTGKR